MSKDKKAVHTGKIEQDEKGNFFCGKYLLDYKTVAAKGFKVGDEIEIRSVISNPSNASNEIYAMKSGDFWAVKEK